MTWALARHKTPYPLWLALAACVAVPRLAAQTAVGFTPPVTLDNAFSAGHPGAAADVDGDGDLDLIAGRRFGGGLSWWENQAADGTSWQEHPISLTPGEGYAVAAADFDRDGDIDIASAQAPGGSLRWWENVLANGTNWSEHPVAPALAVDPFVHRALTTADIDRDGDPDLIVTTAPDQANPDEPPAGLIEWFENNGAAWTPHTIAGSLNQPAAFPGAHQSVAVDLDGDGDIDVAAAGGYTVTNGGGPATNSGAVAWWENIAGTWIRRDVSADFPFAQSIQSADFNTDGTPDLAAASVFGEVRVWIASGSGWTETTANPAGPFQLAPTAGFSAADIDRDGDPDLLTAASAAGPTWFENTGATWLPRTLPGFPAPANWVVAADWDGDADPDLAMASLTATELAVARNLSPSLTASFVVSRNLASGPILTRALNADFSGDGIDDIAGVDTSGDLRWWQNPGDGGAGWASFLVVSPFGVPASLSSGDFDGDGQHDLAGDAGASTIAWWRRAPGAQPWTRTVVDPSFSATNSAAADMDADGDLDLLAAGPAGLHWWRNTSAGDAWTRVTLSTTAYRNVLTADIDRDGNTDILALDDTTGAACWWANTAGDGTTWIKRPLGVGITGIAEWNVGRIDHDGFPDVVISTPAGLEFLANRSNGQTWTTTIVTATPASGPIALGDLDADGHTDIAAPISGGYAWWENTLGDGSTWRELRLGDDPSPGPILSGRFRPTALADLVIASGIGGLSIFDNDGGNIALSSSTVAPESAPPGREVPMLAIDATRAGAPLEPAANLTGVTVSLENAPGLSMDEPTARELLTALRLYADTGSGTYEPGIDALVATLTDLTPVQGRVTFSLPAGATSTLQPATTRRYFVTALLSPTRRRGAIRVLYEPGGSAAKFTGGAPALIAGGTPVTSQVRLDCGITLAPPSRVLGPLGEPFTAQVQDPNLCGWTTSTDNPWLAVQGTGSGTGNGPALLRASANITGQLRTATLDAGGVGLDIAQLAVEPDFADVEPADFFFEAARLLWARQITDGCAAAPLRFCPSSSLSRGQASVFLVRAIFDGDAFAFDPAPHFTDVPATHPFFPWIQKAAELGLTGGCAADLFCPSALATRGQIAVFLIRARLGATAAFTFDETPRFVDVGPSHPFFPWIQKLAELGITSGCGPTSFCPGAPVTRGQMALFILRALYNELLADAAPVITSASPATARIGETVTITLTGRNTNFLDRASAVLPAEGITVGTVAVIDASTLTVEFTITSAAPPGPRSLTVDTAGEQATLPNRFTVLP